MDPLAAAFKPLVMQNGVNRLGGRPQLASVGRPGISKPLGRLTSADKARTMAGRERDRLVKEE
jgi:hypothetical protein